jgi:4-amino-4-deoxy-L-arabinose transferase-like glycosyltransferase
MPELKKTQFHPPGLEAALCLASILLLFVAYFSHLGYLPLNTDTDESRRAIVTAEMMLSNDYLSPTINGELYLNKPPLYNWLVSFWFHLFGNFGMLAFRIQVIVSIAGMALSIFFLTRKFTSPVIAFFTAMAFATNGRILIYDSLQGLIDTSFSWLTYLVFICVFYFGERKKYLSLFVFCYLLTTASFLMKGLPAIVFLGITLLVYFVWKKQVRHLFHFSHFLSILLFVLLTGCYYYLYFDKNNLSPEILFRNLFNESAKRTGLEFGLPQVLQHIGSFPFEMLYHFAPWMMMSILLLPRNMRVMVKQQPFLYYNFLIFFFNILVYWTSPQVYARYLFMFLPLLFVIFFSLYQKNKLTNIWQISFLNGFFSITCIFLCLGSGLLPFLTLTSHMPQVWLKSSILFFSFAFLTALSFRYIQLRLHAFLLALIIFRIGFNWFVIEQRGYRDREALAVANSIVKATESKPLFILSGARVGNLDGISFHISTARNEVLKYHNEIGPGKYFLIDTSQIIVGKTEVVLGFRHHQTDSILLATFKDTVLVR